MDIFVRRTVHWLPVAAFSDELDASCQIKFGGERIFFLPPGTG
jgi:hypothetical protein